MSRDLSRSTRTVRAALGLLAIASVPASAEIKDYQIRRMLMLKTECGVEALDIRKVAGRGEGFTDLFVAACENVAHYPDGVEVLCPDTEDERDCRMLTRKREFQHLHLLKP